MMRLREVVFIIMIMIRGGLVLLRFWSVVDATLSFGSRCWACWLASCLGRPPSTAGFVQHETARAWANQSLVVEDRIIIIIIRCVCARIDEAGSGAVISHGYSERGARDDPSVASGRAWPVTKGRTKGGGATGSGLSPEVGFFGCFGGR